MNFSQRIQVLKKWWQLAPPKTKRTLILSVILILTGLSLFLSTILFSSKKKGHIKSQEPEIEIISKRTQKDISESASVRRLKQKVVNLSTDVDRLKKEIHTIKNNIFQLKKTIDNYQNQVKVFQSELIEKAGKLEEIIRKAKEKRKLTAKKKNIKLDKLKKEKSTDSNFNMWERSLNGTNENWIKYAGGLSGKNLKKEWATPKKVVLETGKPKKLVGEIEENTTATRVGESQLKEITIRIPAGSFFRGVLLNGVDAPVTMVAKKNPYPVLIKVKTEAWLPNEYRYDIKGCYIVAAAWGDMSSERAYFRTERFSCIKKDGGMIETTLDGSVTDGQDGKLGVFGKLVSKQGQMIARTILAEVISGFGNALSPKQGMPVFNIGEDSDSDYYTTPPIGKSLKYGLFSGTGEAMKRIANFYLKMAEQTFPVIEVQAGIPVEIFLLRGVTLTLKKKTENNGGVDNAAD